MEFDNSKGKFFSENRFKSVERFFYIVLYFLFLDKRNSADESINGNKMPTRLRSNLRVSKRDAS